MRIVEHGHAHAHAVGAVPASHLRRRAPGFHVQHHKTRRKRGRRPLADGNARPGLPSFHDHDGLFRILARFQPAHEHLALGRRRGDEPFQKKERPGLVDGPVSRPAFGGVHAGRAAQFTGAVPQQIAHGHEKLGKARKGRATQPRASGQAVIDEDGGRSELGVHGRGDAAEVVAVGHDHQRHESDAGVFQRVDGAHKVHEVVFRLPARAVRNAEPQPLGLEDQRRDFQRDHAQKAVVRNAAPLIARDGFRNPQPPEGHGRAESRPRALHADDGGFLMAPHPRVPVHALPRHLAAHHALGHIKALDHIGLAPVQIDRAGVRLLVGLMPVHAADGLSLFIHDGA